METTTNTNPMDAINDKILSDVHTNKVVAYIDSGLSAKEAIAKADEEMFSLLTVGDYFAGLDEPDL
jgi:hypothetical protein